MADPAPDQLDYYDARDYTLLVTVRASDGRVTVEHQAGDDQQANRDLARLAAEIVDQLTPDDHTVVIRRPFPGIAVLACRCGRALDTADMRRRRRGPFQQLEQLQPIVCEDCI